MIAKGESSFLNYGLTLCPADGEREQTKRLIRPVVDAHGKQRLTVLFHRSIRYVTAPGMHRKENREKSSVRKENRSILRESASWAPFSFSYCTVAPERECGMSVGITSRTVLKRLQSESGRVGVRQYAAIAAVSSR